MALIYIVEDDEPIRRELVDILARAGFEVEACESFEHVSRDILAAVPDLVLLDLTLPVKDGQHICHEVRRESEVPIIVLTSRTTEIDEVMAMTLGADDFVPKPYSARVLVARINALLRRTAASGERSTLVHKGLELDLARSMVTNTQTGTSTELTKNELRILSLLPEPRAEERFALAHHAGPVGLLRLRGRQYAHRQHQPPAHHARKNRHQGVFDHASRPRLFGLGAGYVVWQVL